MGNRLAELRSERRLSQSQLAEALGPQAPDASAISRWETQANGIPDGRKQQLAEFFGVSVGYLMAWEPENRVTLLRESLGWSREQLGDFLDVHERTIYRYERGDASIPDETKARLCDLFGVSLDHLMGRENEQAVDADVIVLHPPIRPLIVVGSMS